MKHYSVEFKEAFEPRGLATACMRGCMCCNQSLTAMGGPGDYVCEECLDKMRSGEMGEALYLLRRQREIEMLKSEALDYENLINEARDALVKIYAENGEDAQIAKICSPLIDKLKLGL